VCHIYHTSDQTSDDGTMIGESQLQVLATQITQIPVLAKDSFSQE